MKQYSAANQLFTGLQPICSTSPSTPKAWHCPTTYTTDSSGSTSLSAPLSISISSWSLLTAAPMSFAALNTPPRSGLLFPFGIFLQLLMHSHASTISVDILLLSHVTCRLAPEKIRSASVDIGGIQNTSIAMRERRGKIRLPGRLKPPLQCCLFSNPNL